MRSSLEDCCSSSFSRKYSSTHCSSNSYRFFSSSGFSLSSLNKTNHNRRSISELVKSDSTVRHVPAKNLLCSNMFDVGNESPRACWCRRLSTDVTISKWWRPEINELICLKCVFYRSNINQNAAVAPRTKYCKHHFCLDFHCNCRRQR